MSDYLTSLIGRARGESGAVRPIVQPVFAPGRADLPSLPVAALPGSSEPETAVPAPRARAAARQAESGRVPMSAPPLSLEQTPPGDTPSPALPTGPVANRLSPTPLTSVTPEPPREAAPQQPVTQPLEANTLPIIAETDPSTGLAAEPLPLPRASVPASTVAPLPPMEARTVKPSLGQPAPQETSEHSTRSAASDSPAPAPVPAASSPVAQVTARRSADARPLSEQIIPVPREPDRPVARPAAGPIPGWATVGNQAATPPPPPAIRVSIGRIEVRAVLPAPPPVPPPAPAPAAPLVTLDAYLRERTGRRDR
jgi:hypothetical protein